MEKLQTQPVFEIALSTTCVTFKYEKEKLWILLVKKENPSGGQVWALPGIFVEPEKDSEIACSDMVYKLTGQEAREFHQARAFTAPERHPAGRVINIAYYALLGPVDDLAGTPGLAEGAEWFPEDRLPDLFLDHNHVIGSARKRLKKRMRRHPVAFRLLPQYFTMNQLQALYEDMFEIELDKRNFRKKVQQSPLIVDSLRLQLRKTGQGRSAKLFYFDWNLYRKERDQLFHFDF